MPKSHIFHINSYNSGISSSNDVGQTYVVNFGNILDRRKKYKLSFTFQSGQIVYTGLNGANYICYITADLNTNSYKSTTKCATTRQIGFARPVITNSTTNAAYLYADTTTNLPIYLENAPQSANLTIKLTDVVGTYYQDDNMYTYGTGYYTFNNTTFHALTATGIALGVGTKITIVNPTTLASVVLTIAAGGTGTGGVGDYNVTGGTADIGSNGAPVSFTASRGYGSLVGTYAINLKFEEVDEEC